MRSEIRSVRVYITADGTEFADRIGAVKHELRTLMAEDSVCHGGEWHEGMILDWIMERNTELFNLLDQLPQEREDE
jgi:hypothetical protein